MRRPPRSLLAVLVALLVVLGGFGGLPEAKAYNLNGCASPRLANDETEYYRTDDGIGTYYDWVVDRAAAAWNSESVPGSLRRTSGGAQIVVNRYAFGYDWYAVTTWACTSRGWYYGARYIDLNASAMDRVATWQDRFLVIHEFGHAMGLAHTNRVCGDSIMRSDAQVGNPNCAGSSPPWRDDVRGMNARY